jgi:hypothetical protein
MSPRQKAPTPAPNPAYALKTTKDPKERLRDAERFLTMGKAEIQDGRATGDSHKIREGSEKVFHALTEAAAARIQKYGLGIPDNHEEIRSGLYTYPKGKDILDVWDDAFARLHVATYYRGWIDIDQITKSLNRVEKAITNVKKTMT